MTSSADCSRAKIRSGFGASIAACPCGLWRNKPASARPVLSDMETGKSQGRPGVLRKIAGILNLSTDELFGPIEGDAAGPEIGC